jgi:peptidyl-prolyl isomerase G (cyclophilin G)
VFGRVVRGYDVVQKIAEVPVDEKDRPQVPVVISNCGELVLRAKPSEAPSRGEYCALSMTPE